MTVIDEMSENQDKKNVIQLQNLKSLSEGASFERIGSTVFWKLSESATDYKQVEESLKVKRFSRLLEPVNSTRAIQRLVLKIASRSKPLYLNNLKTQSEKDEQGLIASFYTGSLNGSGNTKYIEHAKLRITDENITILFKDEKWLLSGEEALDILNNECYKITHQDIAKMLSTYANDLGYRYNQHGGHYFISHKYSDELYELKEDLENFSIKLYIRSDFAGRKEDIEEIVEIVGEGFLDKVEELSKRVFEVDLGVNRYDWEGFKFLAAKQDWETLKKSPITFNWYGSKLIKKLQVAAKNTADIEYQALVLEWFQELTVKESTDNRSLKKLANIKEELNKSVNKLQQCLNQSDLLKPYLEVLIRNSNQMDKAIRKIYDRITEDVMNVDF